MFIYLAKEISSDLILGLTIVNKLMSMRRNIKVQVYMYTCIKIYLFRFDIRLFKFVNKFIIYQIIFCNLLIIPIVHFMVKIIYHFFTIQSW